MKNPIVLFDGVCNFCNRYVQFVIRRDHRKVFRFAALQSPAGRLLCRQQGLPTDSVETVILITENGSYKKSRAILEIVRRLGGFWPILYGLVIFPQSLRDAIYDWIARHRYRWFGKRTTCMIPTPELQERFLD